MKKMSKTRIPLLAMLTAATVTLSLFFIIPVPPTKGFVTLAEAGIYVTALVLGGPSAAIVGAVSGGMIDLLSGYAQWAPFSILIHGLQGYVCGKIAFQNSRSKLIIGLFAASLVMVAGYFLAGALLYGFYASILSVLGNVIQNILGIIVTVPVAAALKKISKKNLTKLDNP